MYCVWMLNLVRVLRCRIRTYTLSDISALCFSSFSFHDLFTQQHTGTYAYDPLNKLFFDDLRSCGR